MPGPNVFASRVRTPLDGLLNIEEALQDRELVLRGKFKDEIARLSKAKADAEEKLGMIATVEQAEKVRLEANSYSVVTKSEADSIHLNAQNILNAAKAREQAVADRENAVSGREAQVSANMNEITDLITRNDTIEASRVADHKADVAVLEKRETDVYQREAECAKRVTSLDTRERQFNERLESLKIG